MSTMHVHEGVYQLMVLLPCNDTHQPKFDSDNGSTGSKSFEKTRLLLPEICKIEKLA